MITCAKYLYLSISLSHLGAPFEIEVHFRLDNVILFLSQIVLGKRKNLPYAIGSIDILE